MGDFDSDLYDVDLGWLEAMDRDRRARIHPQRPMVRTLQKLPLVPKPKDPEDFTEFDCVKVYQKLRDICDSRTDHLCKSGWLKISGYTQAEIDAVIEYLNEQDFIFHYDCEPDVWVYQEQYANPPQTEELHKTPAEPHPAAIMKQDTYVIPPKMDYDTALLQLQATTEKARENLEKYIARPKTFIIKRRKSDE